MSYSDRNLIVERVRVEDLIEDSANANTHPQRSMDAIKDSLRRFGQVEPLIVRRDTNVVLGGNGRLRAMRELGWEECTIHRFDGSDAEAMALAITLNRSAQFSEWDDGVLSEQLFELKEQDFTLEELGFTEKEYESLIDEGDHPPDFPEVDESIPTEHECPQCGYKFSGGS